MINLWLGIAALLALALVFIFLPSVISLRGSELKRQQSNIDIYKSQLQDLESDLANNRIDQAEYEGLSQEIKLNLLADTQEHNQSIVSSTGKWIYLPVVLLVAVLSVSLYLKLGAENELAITQALKDSGNADFSRDDAFALIERLQQQTKKTPDDVEMWYLLGRLNFDLGQYDQAVLGFTSALQLLPVDAKEDQAVAMSQLAQAQFFANDRKLDAATQSLLKDVLAINPNDETALGLLGVSAYDAKRYVEAVGYWQRLLVMMPANNPNAQAIQGGIDKAMSFMSAADKEQLKKSQRVVQPAVIKVVVNLADAIKGKVPANADLFVLAKAENGPPMPLAVQRLSVDQWPITVTLDDSMAMMPALRLSQFEKVIITARISKSGVGNANVGDLQGVSEVVNSQTKQVAVSIDQEI